MTQPLETRTHILHLRGALIGKILIKEEERKRERRRKYVEKESWSYRLLLLCFYFFPLLIHDNFDFLAFSIFNYYFYFYVNNDLIVVCCVCKLTFSLESSFFGFLIGTSRFGCSVFCSILVLFWFSIHILFHSVIYNIWFGFVLIISVFRFGSGNKIKN